MPGAMKLIPGHWSLWIISRWPHWFPHGARAPVKIFLKALMYFDCRKAYYFPPAPPRRLRRLVRGKRVCITGPSKCVLRNPPGLIESYDIVVRLNSTWPVQPERHARMGERCDVWYYCCNQSAYGREIAKIVSVDDLAGLNFVRLMPHVNHKPVSYFFRQMCSADGHLDVLEPTSEYLTISGMIRTHSIPHADFQHNSTMRYLKRHQERHDRPVNTGFFAICELLDCDPAELYITGITFNCEDDYSGYPSNYDTARKREKANTHHYSDGLFEIFKRMRIKDKRIRVDDTLSDIIRLDADQRVEHYSPGRSRHKTPST